MLAWAGSANALIVFTSGELNLAEGNGPAIQNVDPDTDLGGDNVVTGLTKAAPVTQVFVTALLGENIKTTNHSAGVVWIVPVDDGFTHLRFELAPGFSFRSFEVDMQEAYQTVLNKKGEPVVEKVDYNFTLTGNDGTDTFSHNFTGVDHGFYSAFTADPGDSYLKYVEFTTDRDISAIGQIRISGVHADGDPEMPPGVPEPATWAMMILGFGAAGSMIRRRKAAYA